MWFTFHPPPRLKSSHQAVPCQSAELEDLRRIYRRYPGVNGGLFGVRADGWRREGGGGGGGGGGVYRL